MKRFRVAPLLVAIVSVAALTSGAKAQSTARAGTDFNTRASGAVDTQLTRPLPRYTRPTEKTKIRNYLFDAFGPYPFVGAAIVGGIGQAGNAPPEWGQGMGPYGERVASAFGIGLVTTTTRYALASAFREDTLYYRCECKGVFRRLGHALISTVTARRGEDGHRVLSFPAMIAPYAGSMTAVYAWYPGRYDAQDAFRMGNYTLLVFAGGNIAREFIYGGPHTLFARSGLPGTTNETPAADTNPAKP